MVWRITRTVAASARWTPGYLAAHIRLTDCVSFGPSAFGPSAQQPNVDLAALPGTWVSSEGGASITFTPTTFTATNFNDGKVIPTCGTLSGSGTWQPQQTSYIPFYPVH